MPGEIIQSAQGLSCIIKDTNMIWEIFKDLFSPFIALCSLFFAFYVHQNTRNFLMHFERPILSIKQTSITSEIGNFPNGKNFKIKWVIVFSNIGKYPANNPKITLRMFPNKLIKPVAQIFEGTSLIDPELEWSAFGEIFSVKSYSSEDFLPIIIDIEYENRIIKGKKYKDTWWKKYTGRSTIEDLRMSEKIELENLITKK